MVLCLVLDKVVRYSQENGFSKHKPIPLTESEMIANAINSSGYPIQVTAEDVEIASYYVHAAVLNAKAMREARS